MAEKFDELRRRLAAAEGLLYSAAEWMLDHGGRADPLRLRIKKFRLGEAAEKEQACQ